MPLLTARTFQRLVEVHGNHPGPISMLTVVLDDPHGFGRVVRAADGSVREVVEEAQAGSEILAIRELNASVYCFDMPWLWGALKRVQLSPKGEYYLTDLVGIAVSDGLRVEALVADDPHEALGINTREHLAEAEAVIRQRINRNWMLAGVTIVDPQTTYIETEVEIGSDSVLYPGTHLRGCTILGQGCQVGPNAVVINSRLGADCQVAAAWIEDCILEDRTRVDAYLHLRGEAHGFLSGRKGRKG